jgi:hypothetical protein
VILDRKILRELEVRLVREVVSVRIEAFDAAFA